MIMTVFVTQRPVPNHRGWTPDLTTALKYGKLFYIYEGGEFRFDKDLSKVITIARNKLADFNPDEDYLCYPGVVDPLTLTLSVMTLAGFGHEYIKWLRWNKGRLDKERDKGYYEPITLDFGGNNYE